MKILACHDGSATGENATRLGAAIAAACNAEIALFGTIESPGKTDSILDALRRGLQMLEEKKVRAELVTVTGEPVAEIIKRTEQSQFDLVIIGATRKAPGGLFWVSSKTYKIIKSIHPPVLVALEKTTAIKRILICTGGRRHIANAIKLTGQIAAGMQAGVTLFHVMPETPAFYSGLQGLELDVEATLNSKSELGRNLREQKETLESLNVSVEIKLREGAVLAEMHREIVGGNYDLVVTGSSLSRSGLRTYILGDVTREIVNRANCAVMVVRSGAGRGLFQRVKEFLAETTAHPEKEEKK